jgi:ribosomal protein S18 acetylase RimI-like enzyme
VIASSPPDSAEMAAFPAGTAVPAARYAFDRLSEIYNAARVDYIVPMPMNAKRMEEYVRSYDVRLDESLVSLDEEGQPNGICMFGERGDRGWITRLGVIPERRRHRTGEFLLRAIVDRARERGLRQIQLEVIQGNEPAYRLFRKLGFVDVRELIVIRRPPGKLKDGQMPASVLVEDLDSDIFTLLQQREPNPSWVEETASLKNAGGIRGLRLTLPTGESGWIAFQRTPFMLTHFVLDPAAGPDLTYALIAGVHFLFPVQDTSIENLPVDHPAWVQYQKLGYFEAFRRIEMVLAL